MGQGSCLRSCEGKRVLENILMEMVDVCRGGLDGQCCAASPEGGHGHHSGRGGHSGFHQANGIGSIQNLFLNSVSY